MPTISRRSSRSVTADWVPAGHWRNGNTGALPGTFLAGVYDDYDSPVSIW